MPARCDADADNFDERLVLNSKCQARCNDQSKDSKYLFSILAWPPVCGKAVEEDAGPGGGERGHQSSIRSDRRSGWYADDPRDQRCSVPKRWFLKISVFREKLSDMRQIRSIKLVIGSNMISTKQVKRANIGAWHENLPERCDNSQPAGAEHFQLWTKQKNFKCALQFVWLS